MKLWQIRANVDPKRSLKALLYTMVRNRALNSLRRNKWMATDTAVETVRDHQETAPAGDDLLAALKEGDTPGLSMVIVDGEIIISKSRNTPPPVRKAALV